MNGLIHPVVAIAGLVVIGLVIILIAKFLKLYEEKWNVMYKINAGGLWKSLTDFVWYGIFMIAAGNAFGTAITIVIVLATEAFGLQIPSDSYFLAYVVIAVSLAIAIFLFKLDWGKALRTQGRGRN